MSRVGCGSNNHWQFAIYMRKKIIYLVFLGIAAGFIALGYGAWYLYSGSRISSRYASAASEVKQLIPERFVAHAGGKAQDLFYTDSLDAVNDSYSKGFRFLELDFNWTTDSELVIIHDWNQSVKTLFEAEPKQYSLEEFKNLHMVKGLSQMTMDTLNVWVGKHLDIYIVTDIKEKNIDGLQYIRQKYPQVARHLIPQIYFLEEYNPAFKLGYSKIILTLYRLGATDKEIIGFTKTHPLVAVTMPQKRGLTDLPNNLSQIHVPTYVHTIRKDEEWAELQNNGVFGIYTDTLMPNK